MKRKLISAVALIMCAIMFLFCGCKSKKNRDDTTAPSESGAAGEYYVVPNSKKCSLMLTDGKDGELEFDILPCGLFVTMEAGYTLEVKNGKFILAS